MEARVILLTHWSYLVLSCFRLRANPTVSSEYVHSLLPFEFFRVVLAWFGFFFPLGLHLPPFVSYIAAPLTFQIQDCSRLIASTQHPTASSLSRAQRLPLTVRTKAPLPTPLVFHFSYLSFNLSTAHTNVLNFLVHCIAFPPPSKTSLFTEGTWRPTLVIGECSSGAWMDKWRAGLCNNWTLGGRDTKILKFLLLLFRSKVSQTTERW